MQKYLKKYLFIISLIFVLAFSRNILAQANSNVQGQLMIAAENIEVKEAPEEGSGTLITYQSGDTVFVTGEAKDGWYSVSYQGKAGYVPADKLEKITLGDKGDQPQAEGSDNESGNKVALEEADPIEGGQGGQEIQEEQHSSGEDVIPEDKDKDKNAGDNGALGTNEPLDADQTADVNEQEHQEYIDALDREMAAMEAEGQLVVEEVERQRAEHKRAMIWKIVIGVLIVGIFAVGIYSSVSSNNKKEDKD